MAASTSHFASTPPPSPPRASTSTLRVDSGTRHPCKPARDPVAPAIEAVRVADDLDALEARAQGRGMRVLAAQRAADALLRIDPGHGIGAQRAARVPHAQRRAAGRSEEHTSELQSRENLVCRLLREKKKYTSRAAYGSRAAGGGSRSDSRRRPPSTARPPEPARSGAALRTPDEPGRPRRHAALPRAR